MYVYIYIYICNVYMYLYVYTMDLTLCPHRRSEDDPKKDSSSMVSSHRKLFEKEIFSRKFTTKILYYY